MCGGDCCKEKFECRPCNPCCEPELTIEEVLCRCGFELENCHCRVKSSCPIRKPTPNRGRYYGQTYEVGYRPEECACREGGEQPDYAGRHCLKTYYKKQCRPCYKPCDKPCEKVCKCGC